MTDAERSDGYTSEQFEEILDVFTMPGWAHILRDIDRIYQGIDTVRDVQSVETLHHRRGALEQLMWFSHLREWYQQIEDSDADL